MVDLEPRVRGYIADLVILCPLAADQTLEDEPPGSGFDFRLQVRVPSTGQLLRWLLGAGDNVEVVVPTELRHVVAVQAAKMAGLYAGDSAAPAPQTHASDDLAGPIEGGPMLEARRVDCPYCGEGFDTQVDCSSGSQNYIEDCAVCCRPIEFQVEVDSDGDLIDLVLRRDDE